MIRLQREKMFPGFNLGHTGINWLGVDIKESADEYTFNFEVPGALKDEVKIWFDGNILTVSGVKKETEKDGEKKLLSERVYGKFERSFRMPTDVDGNNIKAEFVNGILVVTIPKSEKSKRVNVEIS
ncbi:MAG: Hsp20/alpha crystallin family protein [candidate division Zixibacteria bacterium]